MSDQDLENLRIADIILENDTYKMDIPIKKNSIQEGEKLNFGLSNRDDRENIIYLPTVIKDTIDEFTMYEVEISMDYFERPFTENTIWDICLYRRTNDGMKHKRIKSNDDHLRFFSIVSHDNCKMFYPYTTKKGNLSFRFNEYTLFATFDNIDLTQNGELLFSGFFVYPPLHNVEGYKVTGTRLIVVDTNEVETVVNVHQMKRQDLVAQFPIISSSEGKIGIEGLFDVNPFINTKKIETYRFFLELDYEYNGVQQSIRSTRVRRAQRPELPDSTILDVRGQKKKIECKKTNNLTLVVKDYNFVREKISYAKRRLVKIRRSDLLKKAYKHVFTLFGLVLPVDRKLVMFESFLGKQYSDSPRAIYEYMLENHPEYKMFWSVDRRHIDFFRDKDVQFVRRFSVQWLLLMTRARYWVTNSRLPLWISKPKHTIYLQTWHGTPLKRLAADMDEVHMPGTNTEKYKRNFIREAGKWDYLVSPNAYSSEIFKRAFQFDRTMIESGYPRNDYIINNNDQDTIGRLKERLELPKNKKILLYAPTWRDNQFYAKGRYKFDLQLDLNRIREELGDQYIILLRMHYLVAENIDLSGYEGFVYDFSYHEDIRELYLISDILITDYSSVFFDYANLKRPMLFYVYDIDEYRDNLRGFYFDFEDKAPGPLVKSTEEIINEVKQIESEGFLPSKTTEEFYQKFCYLESGISSKRVVDEVFSQ